MTADPRRARTAAARMSALVLQALEEMRRMLPDPDSLSHDQLADITDEEFAALDAEAKARVLARYDALNAELAEEIRLLEMEDKLRRREVEDFQAAVRELKQEADRERELRLQAANARLLKVAARREKAVAEGLHAAPPASLAVSEPDPLAGIPEQGRQSWWDAIPAYFKDKPQSTENEQNYRREFSRLAQAIGKELPLAAVRRADLDRYHDLLLEQAKPRKGNTILSAQAQGRCLSHIRSFFDWALKREWILRSPAAGLAPKGLTHREIVAIKRRPFTPAELEKLFHAPLFVGCQGPNRLKWPGKHLYRGGKYWLPLLACYTGGRLSELTELQVSDIRREGKLWYAAIAIILEPMEGDVVPEGYTGEVATSKGRGKKAKTPHAKRLSPLHPDFLKLGFLDFVAARRAEGGDDAFIFDEVSNYGPIFNRDEYDGELKVEGILASVGIKHHDTSFHSFRHVFADALRDSGFDGRLQDRLMGHAPSGSGSHYGSQLTAGEAARFAGLQLPVDLTHLLPKKTLVIPSAVAPKSKGKPRKRVLVPGRACTRQGEGG